MPALTAETTDYRLDIDTGQRRHWIVGRDPACELYLRDKGISRFHATIFHVEARFHVVDHSLNGSHLFRSEEQFRRALSVPIPRVRSADADVVGFETSEIEPVEFVDPTVDGRAADDPPIDTHRSVTELKLQQLRTEVPRLPGFRPHAMTDEDAIQEILEMVYGDEAETMASLARAVQPGNVLLFTGFDRHFFRFVE